jgi:murein DD-endopeptidase MepM/ murein hydrolase activator NlpD
VLLAVGAVGVTAARSSPSPGIDVAFEKPAIGRRNGVTVRFSEPERGLSHVKVELIQGGLTKVLEEQTFTARPPWAFWGELQADYVVAADIGKLALPELEEGEATLRVTAGRAARLIGSPDDVVQTRTLPVRLTPPLVQALSESIYVAQGGAEVVVYQVGETSVRDGVEIGPWFFPGYPLPGGAKNDRFSLFAVPYDVTDGEDLRLVAEDELGNKASRTGFIHKFISRPMGTDTIRLSEGFMKKVVEEILPRSKGLKDKGDLLQNYLQLNGELRHQNSAMLRELAQKSEARFLWKKSFMPMKNAAVKGAFADRRTYTFNDEPVDKQDHLGFDLASVSRAPVQAGNAGKVVFADYFGIFGNCVVLDHGYGLQTLYAHLSSLSVQAGDDVERGQEVGRSGATGMAGGDHLHFTMLLQGLPVNPIEWWDEHWIKDRLKLKLKGALPYEG